ncbi:MAG: RHS repeat-associated core domain-containing protein, partial [Bryobacteraceae bacterium]|nr:RHS repeat-associated core domain-containing protein [Bryobacteraceae bacterium]
GAVAARRDYLPYGEEIGPPVGGRGALWAAELGGEQRFTGKERDGETGWDYFGARYFSGALGRFTSADAPLVDQHPEDPQSWNLFSYVRNNPLTFIDPTGNDCIYTNNFFSTGSVEVETGNCSKKGGTFVDGTVDTKSITYDKKKNELGYSYANAEQETGGAGTIGLKSEPTQDEVRMAALGHAGQLASPVTDPRFIAGWYAAAGATGYLMMQAAALESMEIAVGGGDFAASPIHVAYQAGGRWLHATGNQFFNMTVRNRGAQGFAREAWFKFRLPIRSPEAIKAMEGSRAASCVTSACQAFARGWLGR